jgi:uncharacterized membrane protein YjfL (UPF0719 family)
MEIILKNFLYAGFGGVLLVFVMALAYIFFDKVITPYDTGKELDDKNIAVGIVVGSIFIALGIGMGLTVGMGLN